MPKGELNHSNNPTYVTYGQSGSMTPTTSSTQYVQSDTLGIKNIVKSNFENPPGAFAKTTYISKIGIYDKYQNLIAIANLATPIRKREQDQFSVKLKLDF